MTTPANDPFHIILALARVALSNARVLVADNARDRVRHQINRLATHYSECGDINRVSKLTRMLVADTAILTRKPEDKCPTCDGNGSMVCSLDGMGLICGNCDGTGYREPDPPLTEGEE